MFAYVVIALTTQTTAEGGPSAQLTDATAWVPKQMRRHFKKNTDYMDQIMKTPDWVTEIMNKRAKEAENHEEQAKATAWPRMGGAAPGEPGGLANAKPKVPGNAPKWNSKTRGLEKPPRGHVDDRATSTTARTTRLARSARSHGSRPLTVAGRNPS